MAARSLIQKRPRGSRSLYAAGLLVGLLAALLGAWFLSGWHDVRLRQDQTRGAPVAAASRRASELAAELRVELEGLFSREAHRPYFHYQNLMHDPQASLGVSVSPSPLARGPEDPLVLGYFQIDAGGRTSTPTINDEVPGLSEPGNLAGNRAFRDQVMRDLVRMLQPKERGAVVAAVVEVDPSTYAQNVSSNAVYWQQWDHNNPGTTLANTTPRVPPRAPPNAPVTISISPLEWRTVSYTGTPSLVAVRQVHTPDGDFAQGFVLDRSTITSRLAGKAGEMVAELHAKTAVGEPIAPGWQLTVAPNPRSIAAAAGDAASVARTFLVRFIAVGSFAAIAAAFVLLLVMRAEKLARERSQFAAAAAHELRTPLAGLQLYGDMLADGLGDQTKARDYARRMSEEASRLGRVVSNVLGFSQLERGNLALDPQLGTLGQALCELAERAQPALDRAGAALELEVAPEIRARFDRDALARIVGNLLDNAEKYARGAGDRTIGLSAVDKGDVVEVIVSDHGPGIGAKTKLFEAFSRGVPADGPAGLGLGLALSRSLAHAMGGELFHRAADGGGASFVLTLPRA